jgi:quinolinate synthase
MADFVRTKKPARVALITECSMSDNIAQGAPETEFIRPCNLCPHMKLITLKNIRRALENMETEVTIPAHLFEPARRSVERMLAVK